MSTTAKQSATIESGRTMPSQSIRTGSSVAELKQAFRALGRLPKVATRQDAYTALALTVRDRVLKQGVLTLRNYAEHDARLVAYLSAEFLPGPRPGEQSSQPRVNRTGDQRTCRQYLERDAARARRGRGQRACFKVAESRDDPRREGGYAPAGIQTPPPQPPAPPRIRI